MVDRSAFREQVREALLNLYDYQRLHELALGDWLEAEPGYSGPHTLRQILTEAIESLKPGHGTPVATSSWRIYHILFYRFIQGMSVAEVASQLGFGERHFRRHQARAINTLADLLWQRFAGQAEAQVAGRRDEPAAGPPVDVDANLAWLLSEPVPQQVDLGEVLLAVEGVLRHLAAAQAVEFEADIPADLPSLSIHPLALRQVLLNVLSFAIGRVPKGRIRIQARPLDTTVQLEIQLRPGPALYAAAEGSALSVSHQLLAMYNGSVELADAPGRPPAVTIEVPISRRLPVLIIDDNADAVRLFARYLAESRYRPVTAGSGQQGLQLARELAPSAILLDVMMPDEDGWEVLSLLKTHLATAAIPVIVATILTDQELAFSLGAAGFLRKPVSQAELLAALDRVVG